MSKKRSRGWVFTINNWTDYDEAGIILLMDHTQFQYTVFGYEVGEQGTPHIQGYVYFKEAITRRTLSSYLQRARLKPAKGTAEQNFDYCSKDSDYCEIGTKPEQGKAGKELIDKIMQNPYDNFHLYNQYRKAYKELQLTQRKDHERRIYIIDYITRFEVMDQCRDCLYIPGEKYDLYNGEQVVILEYDCTIRDEVVRWKHNHPPTIKRGYELIKFDPEIIYILYSSAHEYATLRKLYYKLISD